MKPARNILRCLLWGMATSCSLASVGEATAAQPPAGSIFLADALEPAPESLILDQARLFDELERSQLAERLQDFRSELGIQVYVVAYSVLIGETIEERVKALRGKWLDGQSGIIVGYQRGNDRMTFSSNVDPHNQVMQVELERLFTNAYEAAVAQEGASDRVMAAVNLLLTELANSYERHRESGSVVASEARTFIAWVLGILVLLASAGMIAFHLARRAQAQVSRSFSFPRVELAERFGAPYSGGCQAELQFTARSE